MSTERRRYYKAVTAGLTGPHYGGLLYLPGTTHRLGIDEPFDADPNGWCTAGLYVASHRRVTARWGPVTLQVELDPGAPLVKTTKVHRPPNVPGDVDSGKYAKYRTTGFRVIRIVGVTVYARSAEGERLRKDQLVDDVNRTLQDHDLLPVSLTGVKLERLRDDAYSLWEVHDPNAPTGKSQVLYEHTFEISFTANRPVEDHELYSHLGRMDHVIGGSQRAKRVGLTRIAR